MFRCIKKRDGRIVPWNSSKIEKAVEKALLATDVLPEDAPKIASEVAKKAVAKLIEGGIENDHPAVEEVQDAVEISLMEGGYYKTAKAYILYREQHRQMREMKAKVSVDFIDTYLNKADWRVKENANTNFSLSAMNNYIAGAASANYWLNKIYPPEIREAHVYGDMHIHDLSMISTYCIGWNLQDFLEVGFRGAEGKVESRPPKHFRSALGQIYNLMYTLQNESAGAQAISSIDTLLAPYISEDGLNYKQVKQSMQEFIFNMNVPTRTAGQVPFTNVTLDLIVPEFMKNEPAIVNGRPLGEFQEQMDMFNLAFCEVLLEGDARQRGFGFPIPTYNITDQIDQVNPKVMQAIFKLASKYGSPYFANFISSDMTPDQVRSMCCRLRIQSTELKKRGGGLFGANPLTGSSGVVTLNLPRLGYLAKDEEDYFTRLGRLANLAVTSLEIKRKVLERFSDAGLYPYSTFYLRSVKERFGKYWANHFSTIGVVGGNEACLNLLGKSIASKEGRELMIKTLNFLRDFIIEAQKETGNLYNLEATPAEGASYRLAKIDKEKYPDIIVANEKEYRQGSAPYYTNSTMLPVNYTDDLWEMLEHQEPLQELYTGGTVSHIFLSEDTPDPDGCAAIIKKICRNFRIPYISLTPTYSVCPDHGYIPGEHYNCPKCGRETEVYSRIVGYYRPVKQWNIGKQTEFRDRKLYKVGAAS